MVKNCGEIKKIVGLEEKKLVVKKKQPLDYRTRGPVAPAVSSSKIIQLEGKYGSGVKD